MRRFFEGLGDDPARIKQLADRSLVVAVLVLIVLVALLVANLDRLPDPVGTIELESVFVIEGPGTGLAPDFSRPLAAAWGPDGRIYVSDTGNSRICVFDSDGEFISETTGAGIDATATAGALTLSQPAGLVVTEEREVYVADIRSGAVFVLDRSGTTTRTIAPGDGSPGSGWHPTDVAIAGGLLYATDVDGVSIFQLDGTAEGRLGLPGAPAVLSRPNGITAGPDGSVVVSDTNAQRVVSFSADGEMLWELRPVEDGDEALGLPRGLAFDGEGTFLVADAFMFGIAAVTADGELADTYYMRGSGPLQFEYPNDVDVRDGMWLIADKDNDRVQVARLVNTLDR